jgi:hypothetical protein
MSSSGLGRSRSCLCLVPCQLGDGVNVLGFKLGFHDRNYIILPTGAENMRPEERAVKMWGKKVAWGVDEGSGRLEQGDLHSKVKTLDRR